MKRSGTARNALTPSAKARLAQIAALSKDGRVFRQVRRCFIAFGRPVTMTELRAWAFAGRPRQHWHYWSITRALRRYGVLIVRGHGRRAGVWAPKPELARLIGHTENLCAEAGKN